MKKLMFVFFSLAIAGVVLTTQSCSDACDDVTCLNGGTCDEGDCDCPEGFIGDDCGTNLCENTNCRNGGVQVITATDCTCDCAAATGYEGDDCNTEMRAKFMGTYSVSEGCTSGNYSFSSTITGSSSDVSNILIGNFYDSFSNPVIASVNGTDLTIALQDPDNNNIEVSGSGSINADGTIVTITYSLADDMGNSDACTATFTKQ